MSSSNAARVQGAGPGCTDGDPIQVCIGSVQPGVCFPVEGCAGGPPVDVSLENGFTSILNSTTVPLAGGGNFTGTFELVTNWSTLAIYVAILPVNAGSTTNGVILEWSHDGITTDFTDKFTVIAETSGNIQGQTHRMYEFPIRDHYYRINYTNGAVAQASWILSTTYHVTPKNVSLTHAFQQRSTLDPITSLPIFSGTWEPVVANGQSVLLGTAARTADTTSLAYRNSGIRGMTFNLNVTAVPVAPGSGGLDLQILQLDGSSNQSAVNAPTPMGTYITKVGLYRWVVGLGATGTNLGPNIRQTCAVPPPVVYRAKVLHKDAQSYTYNVQVDFGQ